MGCAVVMPYTDSTATTAPVNWISTGTANTATIASYFPVQAAQWTIPTAPQIVSTPPDPRLPAPLAFNRFINASDLLEEFIKWLGGQGVRQREVFQMPMEFFIKWLILRACEQDGETPNVTMPALPAPRHQPRCLGCGRFVTKATPLVLHSERCASFYFRRAAHKVAVAA